MTAADIQLVACSVRVSLKERSIEVVGSEKFVQDLLANAGLIQKLIEAQGKMIELNKIELTAEALAAMRKKLEAEVENADDLIKNAKESHAALMKNIQEHLERTKQTMTKIATATFQS